MKRQFFSFLALVLSLTTVTKTLWGAAPMPIPVIEGMPAANNTHYLEMLDDPKGQFDFEKIHSGSFTGDFSANGTIAMKNLAGVKWLRGSLENTASKPLVVQLRFDLASHSELAFYPSGNETTPQFFAAGWKTPFSSRIIATLYPTFELLVPPGRSAIIIKSEGPVFTLNMGSKATISRTNQDFEVAILFGLGTMFALGLYNLFIFTRVKDRSYLYYSMRCVSCTLLTLAYYGALMKYFLPENAFNPEPLKACLTSVDTFLWLHVTRRFLSLDKFLNRKLLSRSVNVLSFAILCSALFPWVFPNEAPDTIFKVAGPISFYSTFAAGIYMCFKRYRPAYFYMLSATIFFAGVLTIILATYGPVNPTMITYLAPLTSSAAEALLMSFGLGDKYMMYMNAANSALTDRNDELDRNLSNMLRNLDQGIFSIDERGKISREHSEYLKTIFGGNEIAGADAFEKMFETSDMPKDRVDQIKNVTLAGLGEDSLTNEMNNHILPREITLNDGKRTQILEVDWQPLYNKEEKCEKMMVVLRDVSDLRTLQKEAIKVQRDLQIAGQVLSMSLPNYEKFSKNVGQLLDQNIQEINAHSSSDTIDVSLMFRNIHTIKGNARTFGLLQISEAAHEVENYFSELRKGGEPKPDPVRLTHDLKMLQDIHSEYNTVISSLLRYTPKDGPQDLVEILNGMHQAHRNLNEIKEKFFSIAEQHRVQRYFPTLDDMISPVLRNQHKIAEDLSKPTPRIVFQGQGIRLNIEMETFLRNIFTQILRNSIDHGIEKPDQRQAFGKDVNGTVTINIAASVTSEELIIEIQDDGGGLNLTALAAKSTIPNLSDEDLAKTIFQTGISTAEHITHISGRGVGMDIVQDLVEKQGGHIGVVFTKPKTLAGKRPFKLVLTFPSSCALLTDQDESNLARTAT